MPECAMNGGVHRTKCRIVYRAGYMGQARRFVPRERDVNLRRSGLARQVVLK